MVMKLSRSEKVGTGLMIAGLFLLFLSAILLFYNIWDDYRAQKCVDKIIENMMEEKERDNDDPAQAADIPFYINNPDMEMPTMIFDGHAYIGRLDIPSLGLSLPVISEWSYPALRVAPCRYSGSAYQNNLIIAGHNYKSHFGKLRRLSYGDSVLFTDVDGNVFEYQVVEIEQLSPTNVEELEDGKWPLTLFTCTIGGRDRVTIRCDKSK